MLIQLPCGCIFMTLARASDFWMENIPPDTYWEDAAGLRHCLKCKECVGVNKEHPAQKPGALLEAYGQIPFVLSGIGHGANPDAVLWALPEEQYQKIKDEQGLVDKLIELVEGSCKGVGMHPELLATVEAIKKARRK